MPNERKTFVEAQRQMLNRYGVNASAHYIDVPLIRGQAHALVSGYGPPILMLNGIGTPGAMWAPLMAAMDGFRLIAVDLPGYGLTDTIPEFTADFRGNVVRFLEEVLDALELESVPIIANSLGGLWASWLGLDRPARVSALIYVGCPAVVLETSAPLPMRLLSVPLLGQVMTRIQPPSTAQVTQLSKMVNEYPLVPELTELLVATERLPGFRETFLATLHTLVRLRGSRPGTRLTVGQLQCIHQAALLIWGRDDPFGSPETGERMAAAMPQAALHVVEGGHAPWLTQSAQIGPTIVRFLGGSA